jgi:hypothetical protein
MMNRRTLLKTGLASLAAWFTLNPRELKAEPRRTTSVNSRLVVFGSDGLRMDTAEQLQVAGAPALSRLNPPLAALSGGGYSCTQPGWASIWSGLPSWFNNAYSNVQYSSMPAKRHIMERLIDLLSERDFFPVWITGKGKNLKGDIIRSPHYPVYAHVHVQGEPGIYHGDLVRENLEVFELGAAALNEALTHDNFCCFIHFKDPDYTGHLDKSYLSYYDKALEVDQYIDQLMAMLPADVDVIYCSDHGFNFKELGEVEDNHNYAPEGMLATNFSTLPATHCTRESVGRLIYKRMGGNPDFCNAPDKYYGMYGTDL